jgi:hypothetical protein
LNTCEKNKEKLKVLIGKGAQQRTAQEITSRNGQRTGLGFLKQPDLGYGEPTRRFASLTPGTSRAVANVCSGGGPCSPWVSSSTDTMPSVDTSSDADGKSTPIQVARGLYNFLRVVGGTNYERSALVTDLSIGLALLIQRKEREREQEREAWLASLEREQVQLEAAELKRLHHFARLAHGAYSANDEELFKHTPVYAKTLLKARWSSSQEEPAYYIAIDEAFRSIVLAIRGTDTFSDVFTDLSLHPTPFLGGTAHAGMTRAALRLYDEVREMLRTARTNYPEYDLVFTGHSLGGGVASILTMKLLWEDDPLLRLFEQHNRPKLLAYSYGTPACVSLELARKIQGSPPDLRDALTTVVLGDDLVPRASAASMDRIVRELAAFNWREQIANEFSEYVNTSSLARWSQHVIRWSIPRDQVQRFVTEIGQRLSKASSSIKGARLGNTFGLVAAVAGSASGWMNWYGNLFQKEQPQEQEAVNRAEPRLAEPVALPQFYPPGGCIWHLHEVSLRAGDQRGLPEGAASEHGRVRQQLVQDISNISREVWNELPTLKQPNESPEAPGNDWDRSNAPEDAAESIRAEPQRLLLLRTSPDAFRDIVLSRRCFNDHLMRNIRRALARLYEQQYRQPRLGEHGSS